MNHSHYNGQFPLSRLRRLRQHDWMRRLVQEHHLQVSDLIWPLFVAEKEQAGPIATMPDVNRLTIDELVGAAKEAESLGIPAVALFPCTPVERKSDDGNEALNPDNLVCRAVRAVKQAAPNLGIICDVALDPYTSHGQDGLVRDGVILNDATIEMLCKQAVVQAKAGCDVIAPSDMMDGRVGAIRKALDAAGFEQVVILAYSAKYASAFYGPFRDAVGSRSALGKADKRTYQMNPANSNEALREVAQDIAEGADLVMVKPGLPYLDIVRRIHESCHVPVLAYQVSGEYAMMKLADKASAVDYLSVMLESLLAFKRAGAAAILTYAARDIALHLKEMQAR